MKRKLIESVVILPENLEYIGKCGKINGTLLVEIERIMEEYAAIKVREAQAKCTIPVVSGLLPLASDEEIQKYVTDRFSESHLLPEIIAFRAIKYYQQGMPPVSGRKCCLDESEGKQ